LFVGEAVHKDTAYPGEYEPIIGRALWDIRDIDRIADR